MARRLVGLVVLALVAASCSVPGRNDDQAVTPTTSMLNDDGFELRDPSPDPTPLPVDDRVRIGTLDNGLTYYVQSNDSPGLGLSLRLVVNAGSLHQVEPESGVAHFLEHMLFNGTERYPGNDLDLALQTIGVEFGADSNAYTSFDETVYQLELSNITEETVDVGFSVLAEWASAATISEVETEAERGVVREEIRLSDEGSGGLVSDAFDEAYLKGSVYEGREPGGRDEEILATTAQDLRQYYERWYRPELMAVVAVGDLPIDRLENEVRERFSSLQGHGPAPERVDPVVDLIDEPLTRVVTHPELSDTFASVDYSVPYWDPGTVGGERFYLMQVLYGIMISDRLSDAVDRGEVDLIEPWAGTFDNVRRQRFFGFNFDAADLGAATTYVLSAARRAELNGFDADELARAADVVRLEVDNEAASSGRLNDSLFAVGYAANYLNGSDISSARDRADRINRLLNDITAADVTDLYRWDQSQSAPLVIIVGPDPDQLPSESQLESVVKASRKPRPFTDEAIDNEVAEQLMTPPAPVAPMDVNDLDELDAVEYVFANGARVRFQQSTIVPSDVSLQSARDGGWSTLDADDAAVARLAVGAVAASGIGSLDRVATRRFLAGKATALGPYILETSEGFRGDSSAEDLEVLFQQLHLAYTDPRIDARGLAEAVERSEELQGVVANEPDRAADDAVLGLLFDDDPRFSVDPPSIAGLDEERALRIYGERFGGIDRMVIAIAGDVEPRVIEDLASRYVGTLPAGTADSWRNVRPDVVLDDTLLEVPVGLAEEAAAVRVVNVVPLEIDAPTRVRLRVLETIVNARLLLRVREELGASYGGFMSLTPSVTPVEEVRSLFEADVDPERAAEVLDVVIADTANLVTNGPSADEVERALTLIGADYELVSNRDFLSMMLTSADEVPLTYDRRLDLLGTVDRASLQELATIVFDPSRRVRLITTPA